MHPPITPVPVPLPDLAHLFTILNHDWVWDFMFESDAHALEMLTFAASDKGTTLFDLSIQTEDTSDAYANSFAVHERHRALILPSFSNGAISVGFGVADRITSSTTFACKQRYVGKIARDDSTGSIFFIAIDPSLNLVEITTYSLFSPTCRAHTFSLYHQHKFMLALRNCRHTSFSNEAVGPSLIYFYEAIETRPCRACNTTDAPACSCSIAFIQKKHPLDSVAEISNMACYTGDFRGTARLSLHSNNATMFSSNYTSSSSLSFLQDYEKQREMIEWALKTLSEHHQVNPLKLIMAEAAAMRSRFVTATDTFLLSSITESILSRPIRFDDSANETLQREQADMASSSPVLIAPMHSMNDIEPSTGMNAGFGTALAHLAALSTDPQVRHAMNTYLTANSNNLLCDSTESISIDQILQPQPPLQAVEMMSPITGNDSCSSQSANERPSTANRTLPVLAPAPVVQSPSSFGAEATKNQIDEDRRRRLELRKARNRESAQRSNLKKKLQMQKLKNELAEAAKHEAGLRAQEKSLREENMRLRTAVMR
ncbi:hypothetical protein BWQ96_10200 [Gracilariopsis chorda]|uniref:BZIP domain-containing protein n=1 Tax=Gracilariopsis chorda TaxID=448386 RepID=A0A2V3IDE3_9FLOR|nr:hypothetical protein BWQ96_10200 [Gracilariopsis chorda]|eukprot:PXF40102.1 hypothetical protein BWQ96_10200 [Gracilariopsis chorda]